MTIASEIQRVQTNIANAYTSLEAKGATMPDTRNSANLASTIDSVPLAEGNTVQAFALGDAKNAVEGDKVLLNYSADILTRDETVNGSSAYGANVQYFTPVRGGVFVKASSSTNNFYKKDIDKGWVIASTLSRSSEGPLFAIGTRGFVTAGWRSSLPYHVNEQGVITGVPIYDVSYARAWNWSCSDDEKLILQPATNYADAPMTVFKYENDSYTVRTVSRKTSGWDMYILPGGDGRYYPVADESTNDIWKYDSITGEFVEKIGTGNGNYSGVSYKGFRITLDGGSTSTGSEGCSVSVHNLSWDGTTWTTSRDGELTTQLKSVLSGVSNTFVFIQKWKNELIFYSYINSTFKSIRIRYNEEKSVFEEPTSVFVDKASPYSVNYGDGDTAVYVPSTSQFILRKVGTPVEESYVAIQPNARDQISPTTTLIGFVKENNNGILDVSTVVDPNAVVPTPPDEYGLKATVKYGGDVYKEFNGTLIGGTTDSEGNVTWTTASEEASVKDIPELLDNTYSSFELVFPIKYTGSGTKHLVSIGGSTEHCVLVYATSSSSVYMRVKTISDSTYTQSNASISIGSKVWLKVSYSSSTGYTLSYSSDGSSWTTSITVNKTDRIYEMVTPLLFNNFTGTLYFSEAYLNVDSARVWEGTKPQINFGSVAVSYGYFRNTLSKPSDKYIEYTGGILGKDDILSFEEYTLTPAVYRNADLENWTNETEASLFGIGSQIPGTFKRLEPAVYLWHDYSHITPVKPETLKPVVKTGAGELSINGTVVGSLTTSSTGVISGFSESDYFTLPNLFKPRSSPWERVICFTTGSDISPAQMITFFNPAEDATKTGGGFLSVYEGKVYMSLSSNGTSWDIANDNVSNTTLSPNTTYYVKLKFTGTEYQKWLSTTGEFNGEETLENTVVSSTLIYQESTLCDRFGFRMLSLPQVFTGSIDLSKSYTKINDEYWWKGFIYDSGTVSLPVSWKHIDNILYEYPDGFPTTQASALEINIIEGSNNLYATKTGDTCGLQIGEAGLTVSSNYPPVVSNDILVGGILVLDVKETTDFEFVMCVDNLEVEDRVTVWVVSNLYRFAIEDKILRGGATLTDGSLLWFSGSTVFSSNTKYWFKVSYKDGTGTLSYSTDGSQYTVEQTVQTSGAPIGAGKLWITSEDGSDIILKESYVKVEGSSIWEGSLPADSSAVIGTVELDTNGTITNYTPLVSYSIEVNGLDLSDYLEETTIEYAEELYTITKMPITAFGDLFTVGTRYRVELIEPEGYSIVFCRPDTLQWGTPATYYRHAEDVEYVLIALVDESDGQRFLPFSGKLTIGVGGGLLG